MEHQYASTVVGAMSARNAEGHKYASTVVGAIRARSAVGQKSASTVVGALSARSAVGHRYASTVVYALHARSGTRRNSSCSCIFDRLQTTHSRLGLYFLPGVDLVGGLLRVEALVSLAALGFAGVDFFAGFFAGVVAFLGVDFLPAFFSATAP